MRFEKIGGKEERINFEFVTFSNLSTLQMFTPELERQRAAKEAR